MHFTLYLSLVKVFGSIIYRHCNAAHNKAYDALIHLNEPIVGSCLLPNNVKISYRAKVQTDKRKMIN